jgi:hypothetical protein
MEKSRKLFPAIWKIADIYRYEAGFIRNPDFLIGLFIIIPLFFLLRISLSMSRAGLVCSIIFLAVLGYGFLKTNPKTCINLTESQ